MGEMYLNEVSGMLAIRTVCFGKDGDVGAGNLLFDVRIHVLTGGQVLGVAIEVGAGRRAGRRPLQQFDKRQSQHRAEEEAASRVPE